MSGTFILIVTFDDVTAVTDYNVRMKSRYC